MLNKNHSITLVFISLLLFVAIGKVFADVPGKLEQAKTSIISLIKAGNYAEAQVQTQKLIADFPDHKGVPQAIYDIAYRYHDVHRDDKALELYQYNVEHFLHDIHAMWSQVEITYYYIIDGNDTAADKAFNKLLTVFSGQDTLPKEISQVAVMYKKFHKPDKALALHRYNLEHFPKSMYAMWSQVEIIYSYIDNKDDAAADAAFDKLIATYPQQQTLLKEVYQVADAYSNAGRHEKAKQLYQYVIDKQSGQSLWTKASMAHLNILLENETAAQAAFNSLMTDFKNNSDLPGVIFAIGERYYNKGLSKENEGFADQAKDRFEKAINVWNRLINELPASASIPCFIPGIYCWTGECHQKLGQYEKSIQCFQKVVDDYPDYEYAWNAQFMVGRGYEELKNSGAVEKSIADTKIKAAYEQVIQKYPDCHAVEYARHWLSSTASVKPVPIAVQGKEK